MKLSEICKILGLEFVGADKEITMLNDLAVATDSEIAFMDNEKFADQLKNTKAAAVLTRAELAKYAPASTTVLVTDEPYLMMARVSEIFAKSFFSNEGKEPTIGENCQIFPTAHIGKNSTIGDGTIIMPSAFVGENVTIGKNVKIYPNVTIYNNTIIGDDVIINAGTVIGGDGFGYAHTKIGEHIKIHHFGKVIIEDKVEIGANSCVDRSVFGVTLIKKGSKIDNLVQIAHNVELGENTILVSQVGVSGSTKIGRNFVAGGQVGIAGHLKIADFVQVAAKGGVSKSITKSGNYAGFPLLDHRSWLKLQAKIKGLIKK